MTVQANPNVPHVQQPIADLAALTAVAIQLKQGVDSLAGNRGTPYDRAVTFNDLLNLGLLNGTANNDVTAPSAPGYFANWMPDPAGTSSHSYVMMGFALGYRPARDGDLFVSVSGVASNSNAGGQTNIALLFGTGTPPANGAPEAGALASIPVSLNSSPGGALGVFALSGILPGGFKANVSYWIDLAVSVTTGTGTLYSVTITGMELR